MTRNGAWSIQDVVRRSGVTSRALRHYDAVGLLAPSFVTVGGVRHYDDDALVRLQRILLLRDLGLSLAAIGDVLSSKTPRASEAEALQSHLDLLKVERVTLDRRIAAVRRTIRARQIGEAMTEEMFDGFDHARYKEEVTRRWGREAYETSNAWWERKSPEEKRDVLEEVTELNAAWVAAASSGEAPTGPAAQRLAARHVAWLASTPGSPAASGDPQVTATYVLALADMYVGDDRFRANWTGDPVHAVENGPEFVRDTLRIWVEAQEQEATRAGPRVDVIPRP